MRTYSPSPLLLLVALVAISLLPVHAGILPKIHWNKAKTIVKAPVKASPPAADANVMALIPYQKSVKLLAPATLATTVTTDQPLILAAPDCQRFVISFDGTIIATGYQSASLNQCFLAVMTYQLCQSPGAPANLLTCSGEVDYIVAYSDVTLNATTINGVLNASAQAPGNPVSPTALPPKASQVTGWIIRSDI